MPQARRDSAGSCGSIVVLFLLATILPQVIAGGARAQPAQGANADGSGTQSAAQPAPRSRPAKHGEPDNPFASQMVPWYSLAPQGASLIRPGPRGSLDMTAREDETYITVYAKKKAVDPRDDREHDYSAATWSDVALPKDIPIGPPGNCSSGAYRTIGGQSATGNDLMGGLGGGRC